MTRDAREDAVRRLETALVEQDRMDERYHAAVGTSSEFGAYVRLQRAGDEVAAREVWLQQVDEDGAGGRVWVNGREVGSTGSMFVGLEDSYD